VLACCSCSRKITKLDTMQNVKAIDVQGHRGCRGLLPENTIPAFKRAIDLGVTTLELDLVISKDKEVIISHEPFFSHEITTTPDGSQLTKENEHQYNLYQLTYEEIKQFDVGSIGNVRFPEQQKMKVYKPSLKEMVIAIEAYVKQTSKALPLYNVEIKRKADMDEAYHPGAAEFARLVVEVIEYLGIKDRTFIQSFDPQSLLEVKAIDKEIKLVYLIGNEETIIDNLGKLDFTPNVYSPHYKLVDAELMSYCHQSNMTVVPWTVNDIEEMKQMLELGVDGIITDYPDKLLTLLKSMNIPVQ